MAYATMEDFDPNAPSKGKKKQPTWATFVPNRSSGQFKIHYGRGPALNACAYKRNFILYCWNDDVNKWSEVTRGEDIPRSYAARSSLKCEACNLTAKEIEQHNPSNYYISINYEWIGRPRLRLVPMCSLCRRNIRNRPIDDRSI